MELDGSGLGMRPYTMQLDRNSLGMGPYTMEFDGGGLGMRPYTMQLDRTTTYSVSSNLSWFSKVLPGQEPTEELVNLALWGVVVV